MLEYLDKFYKRMEFAAVVDSIVNRRNTSDEIEKLFDKHQLDNIIISVLVYIMEITLTEDEDCTIESIISFVRKILPKYCKEFLIEEVENISRYIVKDILQNKGEKRSYGVMDYENGFSDLTVRLISDRITDENKIVYELTRQGYDFIFRTKEVDDELGFRLEEFKLKMLISKKNYKKAISQSKELIRMLINKRNELNQFESKLKNNITSISGIVYDTLIYEVNNMLEQEYDIMKEIEEMITIAVERLVEEEKLHGFLDEKAINAKVEVAMIAKNVNTALVLQRKLLTECKSIKKIYLEMLADSIAYSKIKTYNFEENILNKLETVEIDSYEEIFSISNKLLNCILMPDMNKTLNINLIYDNQSKLKAEEEEFEVQEDETYVEDERKLIIERRNNAHVLIIHQLLRFAHENSNGFLFSDFFEHIKMEKLFKELVADRIMFLTLLKLYEYQLISIEKWRNEEEVPTECNGEFDLSYCLYVISNQNKELYNISEIRVHGNDEIYVYEDKSEINGAGFYEKIAINNLFFEVKLNE